MSSSSPARNTTGSTKATTTSSSSSPAAIPFRDPGCGVLTYHRGTERSLLTHVENAVKALDVASVEDGGGMARHVLEAIDQYCLERHWMMHCGPIKGQTLLEFLKECVATRRDQQQQQSSTSSSSSQQYHRHHHHHPLIVVELGTYCGYASMVLARALRDEHWDEGLDFHVFSVEANAECVAVATRLIELANLERTITVILNEDLTPLSNHLTRALRRTIREQFPQYHQQFHQQQSIDFLFLDHDKEQYLLDLQTLEEAKFIQRGTYVAADNVIFAHIDDYRNYMQDLQERGIVETRLVETNLEYAEPDLQNLQDAVRDGIELTIYLEDPPVAQDS